jgi:hypothetical protein
MQVTLSMKLQDAASTPLTITLDGTAVSGGGVSMSSGAVTFGPYGGIVTSLNGDSITATVKAQSRIQLVISLKLDQARGTLTGTVTGSTGGKENQ